MESMYNVLQPHSLYHWASSFKSCKSVCEVLLPHLVSSMKCVYDVSWTHVPLGKFNGMCWRCIVTTSPDSSLAGPMKCVYDVLSLNNSRFGDFVNRIYPIELEIKDTTDTDRSASYLDLHLEIDNKGRLRTKHCDNRDDFNFPIVNFPFICSNIPAAPACGVYISQLIRYSRACGSYQDFLDIWLLLTRKLLNQGLLLVKLKSSLRKFYGRHHDMLDHYGISVPQTTTDMSHLS
jgi:hypothetical protein